MTLKDSRNHAEVVKGNARMLKLTPSISESVLGLNIGICLQQELQ